VRHVSIESVVPGMVNARHIYPPGEASGLPLLAGDVVVTEAILERLVRAGVGSILVDDDLSAGIEALPVITDDTRRKAIGAVRDTFATMQAPGSVLTRDQLKDVDSIVAMIMGEIGSRRNLLVALSDLNQFGGDRLEHAVNVCVVGCAVAKCYFDEHGWRDFRGNRREDHIPDRIQKLGIGLLLQDIGSMAIPDTIWDKRGVLTAQERAIMQQHPFIGMEMLDGSDVSPLTKVAIAQHHERHDGSGYPRGLKGEQIHDHGQIAGIADTYIAMCSQEHDGAKVIETHEAWSLIDKAAGRMFSPEIVQAFRQAVAPYGPGTSVELDDGKVGIIVTNHSEAPQRPIVRVTHDKDCLQFVPPLELDLREHHELNIACALPALPHDREHVA
jgi:HD-GYP domain-containing protein (c-di-GMP phosphodiesterase class II)